MFKFILIFTLSILSSLALCPPLESLSPCTCSETELTITCEYIRGRWDIKQTFDTASTFIDPNATFELLEIRETSLFDIPPHSIPTLKFRKINIHYNTNLEYISSLAFNATYEVTTKLDLWSNYLKTDGGFEREIYDFISQFKILETVWIPSNRLTSIPDDAFSYNPHLKQLYLGSNSISTIGKRAFSQLPNLSNLWMSHNNLTYSSLTNESFSGIGPAVVDLSYADIDYLDEGIFRPLLENGKEIEVGYSTCNHFGCFYGYLTCDERANWICNNDPSFSGKLVGFRCRGGVYADVWEYCQSLNVLSIMKSGF